MTASTLVESSTGAKRAGAGVHCRPGGMLGQSWQASQSPRQFSICCLHAVTRSKQDYAHALQVWSLSFVPPSSRPHWFSNWLRGFVFLVLDPRAKVSNMWLELLLPREDLGACDIPLLLCAPHYGCVSQSYCFSSLPTKLHVYTSLQPWL